MSGSRPPSVRQRLQQAWLSRGLVAWLLWPVSLLMRSLVAARRAGYRWGLLRSEHPGVPVIVVGNVVAGGAVHQQRFVAGDPGVRVRQDFDAIFAAASIAP